MRKVKWGIISTGNIASNFTRDLREVEGAIPYAVASRDLSTAQRFSREFGIEKAYGSYEQLIEDDDIDVVYIGTPHHLHYQLSKRAIATGRPVVCEKPLTTNTTDTQELVQMARKEKTYLLEAMWMYFMPAIHRAIRWVRDGRIGKISHFQADFGFHVPFDPRSRLFNPELGGGAMLDIGIYPVAFAWLLMNSDPLKITVQGGIAGSGVEDDVTVLADYGDVTGILRCSFRSGLLNQAMVFGTEGAITIPNFWGARECDITRDGKQVEHFQDNSPGQGYYHEIAAVGQDLESGRTESAVVSLDHSLKFQEHIDLILSRLSQPEF